MNPVGSVRIMNSPAAGADCQEPKRGPGAVKRQQIFVKTEVTLAKVDGMHFKGLIW